MGDHGGKRALLVGLLLVGIGAAGTGAAARPAMVHPDVKQALGVLKGEFRGLTGVNPTGAGMEQNIAWFQPSIQFVLEWAERSDANASALANELSAPMRAFAERFPRSKPIDEALLKDHQRLLGTARQSGLAITAYLLLGLARQRGSPAFLRNALTDIFRAFDAHAYIAESTALYQLPAPRASIEREMAELGGMGSTFGAEIAWVCDELMLAQREAKQPILPEAALAVAREYKRWRDEECGAERGDAYYHMDQQFRIMGFVKRVVETLPAPMPTPTPGSVKPAKKR